MSMDACMFCGAAPCECPGRKKKAKPKGPAKNKAPATTGTKPAAKPAARPAQNIEPPKKRAAPPVSKRNKIKPQSAPRSSQATGSDNEEFWQAVRVLVAEDMLHPSEMQRVLTTYPRRPV